MTLALFPGIAPTERAAAPADPPSCSVHTSALSTPDSVPAPSRRRVVHLRRRGPRRTRPTDAAEFTARTRLHDSNRRLAVDVIGAALSEIGRMEAPVTLSSEDHAWLVRHAAALDACSEVQAFRHALCGRYHVKPAGCHSRVCPSCEHQRAADLGRRMIAWLDTVPRKRRSYLVLTARNTYDLAAGYSANAKAFGRLRDRAIFRGGKCRQRTRDGRPFHPCTHEQHPKARDRVGGRNCPAFRHEPVAGGVAIDEVTFHECNARVWDRRRKRWTVNACSDPCPWVGSWHPHLNVLMDAPYIAQAEIANAWRDVTCPVHRGRGCPAACEEGSFVVWIEAVDPGTVREAVKYVTKPAALVKGDEPWPLVTFLLASRGRRLVRGFGSSYGVDFERDPADEVERVKLYGEEIAHDRTGRSIRRVYSLPRFPECCGQDSILPGGQIAWDLPILVPRLALQLENGVPSWRPPRPNPRR